MRQSGITYCIFILILISGCDHKTPSSDRKTTTTTDMLGREVQIPEKVDQIVALNAGMLRLITWLDATELVCGIEYNERRRDVPYLFAHPELRDKPVIGTGNTPDPELLTALKPDIIFSTYITPSEADKLQSRTGVPVIGIQYGNFDDEIDTVFSALKYMGELLGKSQRAEMLIVYIQSIIADLETRTTSIPENERPLAYIGGIAYRGSHGITSTEPRYPPFRFLGVKNAASSLGAVMTSSRDVLLNAFIDKEQLIEWNPDVIYMDMSGNLLSESGENDWMSVLKAEKSGDIYTVFPYNWYTINYSTILVNGYFIGQTLYPDRFTDVDPSVKAREIYKTILGRDVYDDMVKKFGECRKIKLQN